MRIVPPDCQKNHFRAAEGIGKRSVSRLESAGRALPVRGKGRVSRLSVIFQKAAGMSPLCPQSLKKGLKAQPETFLTRRGGL